MAARATKPLTGKVAPWLPGPRAAPAAYAAASEPAPSSDLTKPDADLVQTYIPDWPLWLLVPAALVFSVVNAAVEEAAYRGVVLHALEKARITTPAALVLQAAAFASLHFQAGFPRGVVGVGADVRVRLGAR